ncbi:MAG TPA: DUF2066 domain-containing protein [Hyphomicrobiaceae bacterium]|nr:DUF2066 domain-containing protein [Hyphomicrobiaceae bacterium]
MAAQLQGSAFAAPADKVFVVGSYPVEASAGDATTAKEKALAEGQQAAFRSLLKRLVPVTSYNRLPRLKNVKAAELISGYAVRSERNSDTDYVATLDFTFQAEAVRNLLRREGVPFLDEQAPQTIVVPVWRAAKAAGPAASNAALADAKAAPVWEDVWKGLDLENSLTPLKLETTKADLKPDTVKGLVDGQLDLIRSIAASHRAERVMLAVAEPDISGKKLIVTIVGQDAVGAFHLQKAHKLEGSELAYTAELAAVISLGIMEGRWKAVRLRGGAAASLPRPGGPALTGGPAGADTVIHVEFRGMGEWQHISRALSATPGVENLDVLGLSARGARITLAYPGGPEALAQVLRNQRIILHNTTQGWKLRAE